MMENQNSVIQYKNRIKKRFIIMFFITILVLISFFVDVSTGPGNYPLSTVLDVLWDKTSHGLSLEVIILDYRLPIAIMAVLVGAMLATAGAQMQTLLNNYLAEPFTLGVAAAASFGAALGIVYGNVFNDISVAGEIFQNIFISVLAFLFALLTCILMLILTRIRGIGQQSIILFGIAIYFLFTALLAIMQYGANETQLQQIVFWMMGSLTRADNFKIIVSFIALVIALFISLRLSWQLTALRLGEQTALTMGINIRKIQVILLICISLLAGLSVAFVGAVGFVGLVGPHIARLLIGEDQRFFIPLAALIGGLMLSITSVISKTITPGILYPIGMITALIGVPIFISIIMRSKKTGGI